MPGSIAGIGGGLFAITYEIVTFDAVAAPLAANALLMAYIGGATTFVGPVLGAVLITLLQSGVSLMSNSWLIYVGVLFIAMVTFAPAGLTGIILAHAPICARRAAAPLAAALSAPSAARPAIVLLGFVGLVELLSFLTIGAAQGKHLVLFGHRSTSHSATPWVVVVWSAGGRRLLAARGGAGRFARVWDGVMDDRCRRARIDVSRARDHR